MCPNNCSSNTNNGVCIDGFCKCNQYFSGTDCSIQSVELSPQHLVSITVQPYAWTYFHVIVLNSTMDLIFTISVSSGDPDFYVGYNYFPTLIANDYRDIQPASVKRMLITIKSSEIKNGRYILGIFGYCCTSATTNIAASFGIPYYGPPEPIGWKTIFGYAFVSFIALVIIIFGCYRLVLYYQGSQIAPVIIELNAPSLPVRENRPFDLQNERSQARIPRGLPLQARHPSFYVAADPVLPPPPYVPPTLSVSVFPVSEDSVFVVDDRSSLVPDLTRSDSADIAETHNATVSSNGYQSLTVEQTDDIRQ